MVYCIIQSNHLRERMILIKGVILFSLEDGLTGVEIRKIYSNKEEILTLLEFDLLFKNPLVNKDFETLIKSNSILDINNKLLEPHKFVVGVSSELIFDKLATAKRFLHNIRKRLFKFYNAKLQYLSKYITKYK